MRPLILCDCDEVLLRFAAPFAEHLAEAHGMQLGFDRFALAGNIRHAATGEAVAADAIPGLLDDFFRNGLARQTAVPGAKAALRQLSETHDIVILTNITDEFRAARSAQVAALGMPYDVICNSGPKGPALKRVIGERGAERAIFIDDLPPHHESVAASSPSTYRVHMVADARLRTIIGPAAQAHVRIDEWPELTAHLLGRQHSRLRRNNAKEMQ